jgi:hypothetical protein
MDFDSNKAPFSLSSHAGIHLLYRHRAPSYTWCKIGAILDSFHLLPQSSHVSPPFFLTQTTGYTSKQTVTFKTEVVQFATVSLSTPSLIQHLFALLPFFYRVGSIHAFILNEETTTAQVIKLDKKVY